MQTNEVNELFDRLNTLRISGIRVWSETLERFAPLELEVLRLAHRGAWAQYEEAKHSTDSMRVVEAWARKMAIGECLGRRLGHRPPTQCVDVKEVVLALEDIVLRWSAYDSRSEEE